MICYGLKLPFVSITDSFQRANNQSAVKEAAFVQSELKVLLESGRISELTLPPHVIAPLSVAENKSKKRLILDLRHTNAYLPEYKFKMEDWRTFAELLEPNGWLFKFDIKSAYHHVVIHPDFRTYLGFSWKDRYYVFNVLPFGLSMGPYIFTKLMRVLVKYWRQMGIRITMYLDDGAGTDRNQAICAQHALKVKSSLGEAGFATEESKCIWTPSQCEVFLGLLWNLRNNVVSIPQEKLQCYKVNIDRGLMSLHKTTARHLAKIAGQIMACKPVIGNVARLMSRSIYAAIDTAQTQGWDTKVDMSAEILLKAQISFWSRNLLSLSKGRQLFIEPVFPESIIFTDASNKGGAACLSNKIIAHLNWQTDEAAQSSTWRELKTIVFGLKSLVSAITNKVVLLFTDSLNSVRVLDAGSSKLNLQLLAEEVYELCIRHNISLQVQWIPRNLNETADAMAKYIIDWDDWGVNKQFFSRISKLFGPFSVDRFANSRNTKLKRFNSKFYCPGTEAIDAFSQNWSGETNWLVPPVKLIPKVLKHMVTCKAKGVLIAPHWPSAVFYPLLFQSSDVLENGVVNIQYYGDSNKVYVAGTQSSEVFSEKNRNPFQVMCIVLNYSE